MILFDFADSTIYEPPLANAILFNFENSTDITFNQQINLSLKLNQALHQKLIQLETINQTITLTSGLNQIITKGFAVHANAKFNIKFIQEIYRSLVGFGQATTLFNEPLPIQQISLTFDQLGRPLVFYRVGEDTLKLYWYDPIAQQNVLTNFGAGKDPTACFDFPQDTGQSFTDVLLFYVREDQVFMRVQRDRYAIEYPCPATQQRLKINSAGLRVDNRLQVVYEFKDDGYTPPVIEPPPVIVVPPPEPEDPPPSPPPGAVVITGRHYYKLPQYLAALITEQPVITNRYNWSAGFSLRGVDASKSNSAAILSQSASVSVSALAAHTMYPVSLFIYYSQRLVGTNGLFYARVNRREFYYPANEPLQDGRYEITAGNGTLTIKRDGRVVASGALTIARHVENDDDAPLTFGSAVRRFSDSQGQRVYQPIGRSINAEVYNAWAIAGGAKIEWPLNSSGSVDQPSKTGNNPINIVEHRSENWRFSAS